MKYLIYMLIIISGLHFPLQASANLETFEDTLNQLSAKKLPIKLKIIEQIIKSNNPRTEFILSSILDGRVFYIKGKNSVLFANKENNKYITKSLLNDEPLGIFTKRQLKKVSINNKIRKKIKQALAVLYLHHTDESVRLKAVKDTYNSINKSIIDEIELLIKTEKSEDIIDAMHIAINIYLLEDSSSINRIKAIENLEGSLDTKVKILLTKLKDTDLDKNVRIAAEQALLSIKSRTEIFNKLEVVFFGVSFGSVLILAAIGLAITFGVMGVINMAHGELIMLGAYTTYVVQLVMPSYIELSVLVAIPMAFIVSGSVGILIQRGVIRHLHGRPLETLLATFGVSLVLQQAVRTVFTPLNRAVQTPDWMSGALEINGILSLTWNRLYIIMFCLIVFAALVLVLKKTSLGLQVRAVSQDRNMARAMGVRSNWVDAMTFGLGSGVAGIAGVALSQLTNVGPNLGQSYIIDSFMVVVFGGVGNIWGTLISGFSLGIINKFLEPWAGAVLAKVLILVFIILFIQKRPRGLFPQKGRSAGG
ncbi:MAG: urea ABC transporter permease subunit UrtB [PS1 clade bacterium]